MFYEWDRWVETKLIILGGPIHQMGSHPCDDKHKRRRLKGEGGDPLFLVGLVFVVVVVVFAVAVGVVVAAVVVVVRVLVLVVVLVGALALLLVTVVVFVLAIAVVVVVVAKLGKFKELYSDRGGVLTKTEATKKGSDDMARSMTNAPYAGDGKNN